MLATAWGDEGFRLPPRLHALAANFSDEALACYLVVDRSYLHRMSVPYSELVKRETACAEETGCWSATASRRGFYRHLSRMRDAMSIRGPWLATLREAPAEIGQLERSNRGRSPSGIKRVRDA